MPYLLRKIRKAKWYKEVPWLEKNEIQADALSDLITKDNVLSMWYVEEDKANLQRIVVALATGLDHPSNIDYALVDLHVVEQLGIRIEKTTGNTLDREVSERWHRDLIELTVTKLVELAKIIRSGEESTHRIRKKIIIEMVARAVESSYVEYYDLSDSMRKKIEPLL